MEKLLSQPSVSDDLAPYWAAFHVLSRDRPVQSISLGLAGGLSLPRSILLAAIREEGARLSYEGDDLEDFESILVGIDDIYVEVTVKKEAANAKAAADRARQPRKR